MPQSFVRDMSNETTHIRNEKLLTPRLRFKEFREELEETRFGKVVESNLYGPRFNANDYSENGNVKTIRGTDLGRDGEIKYDQVPLARLDDNTVSNHKLEDGDIVMITTAECGATGVFRKQDIDYLSSAYGVRIRLNKLGFPYYFKYFFQTHLAKKEINSFIRKATVANLPGSDILRIKLFLPTHPEQQKIASFLSAVDEKIQQLTRKKELLEQYKKGVMQQLFSGKLRFKDEKGKLYPKWEEKKLGEIGEIVSGLTYSPEDVNENGVLVLRSSNVQQRQIVFDDNVYVNVGSDDFNPVQESDILICVRNGSRDLIGKNALIGKESIGLAFGAFMTVFRSKFNKYLFHYFDTAAYKKAVHRNLGATINSINGSDLKKFKVSFPTEEEQQKIASFLTALDAKIESVAAQIAHTQTFKKGLLQQMFV